MPEPSFAKSLFACDDATSLTLAGGNRFIRKLPDKRSLGYLHKLYTPLTDEGVRRLSDALGYCASAEFEDFLRWSNGASLFDNNIQIFGLVERLNRSLSPDDQQPISVETENLNFRVENDNRWSDGWLRIGSITGEYDNVSIEISADGACTLRSKSLECSFESFDRCMNAIVDRIGTCFTCNGIVDGSHGEFDSAVASLFSPQ